MADTARQEKVAQLAIDVFTSSPANDTGDEEDTIMDLVADLLILADSKGIPPEQIVTRALWHAKADIAGEP